jgi:hypothetical protein
MNTELAEAALWAHGRRLVVLDDGEAGEIVVAGGQDGGVMTGRGRDGAGEEG